MNIIVRKGVSRTDGKFSVFLIRTSAMFDYYTLLGKKAQDIFSEENKRLLGLQTSLDW